LAAEKNEKNRDKPRKEKDMGSPSVTVTPIPLPGISSAEVKSVFVLILHCNNLKIVYKT
jgi:hypothetical protein